MHPSGKNASREQRVIQVKRNIPEIDEFKNYIPVDEAVKKLERWQTYGVEICYLTSRKSNKEIKDIQNVLNQYGFPKGKLYFRGPWESYGKVAERVLPDVLIEDDCESIGGKLQMTYPHIKRGIKEKIRSVVIKEFSGIDTLSDNPDQL